MVTIFNISNCDGCFTLINLNGYLSCSYFFNNKDGSCPCTNCLVKVICEEACSNYKKWGVKMNTNFSEGINI